MNGYTVETFKEEFSIRLRSLIKQSGLSAYAVSKRSGLSQAMMWKLVHGVTIPSVLSIIKLKYALDCDYEDLIGFCDFIG